VHPQPAQESIFKTFLLGELDLEVYLDHLLRATTKKEKRSSTFLTKKCTHRQNSGYAYAHKILIPRFCNSCTNVWNVRKSHDGCYQASRDKAARWLCVHAVQGGGLKKRDWKTRHQTAGLENAGKPCMESQMVYFTCSIFVYRSINACSFSKTP